MCQFVDKVFGVFAESLQPFPTMDCILVQLDQQKATRQRRMREKAAQTNLSQIYSIWNIAWGKTNQGLFDLKKVEKVG